MNDKNVSTQSPSVRCPNRVLEIEFLIWLLDGSLVIGEDGTPGRWECLCWRRGQGGFSLMVNMHIINIDDGVWHLLPALGPNSPTHVKNESIIRRR